MKSLVRSKSDTNLFFEKENLDIINYNLKNIKNVRNLPSACSKKFSIPKPNILRSDFRSQSAKILDSNAISKSIGKSEFRERLEKQSELIQKNFKTDNKIVSTFKTYLKMILTFKLTFDDKFFRRAVERQKYHINLILEIILVKIVKVREMVIIDSEGRLLDSIHSLEEIIKVLIKHDADDFFKEVKTRIFNKFELTVKEIKRSLENSQNELVSKFFDSICYSILFVISTLSFQTDYHAIAINSLVDKLNRFFIDFVKLSCDEDDTRSNENFVKALSIVEKFVKIKGQFMKEFCYQTTTNSNKSLNRYIDEPGIGSAMDLKRKSSLYLITGVMENASSDNLNEVKGLFYYDKFTSFGRYFFNNILEVIDTVANVEDNRLSIYFDKSRSKEIYLAYKSKLINRLDNMIVWKNFIKPKKHIDAASIDKFFKLYYNAKLLNWKCTFINNNVMEKCRICKSSFDFNIFVKHSYYCKERKVYNFTLTTIANTIEKLVKQLSDAKENLFSNNLGGSGDSSKNTYYTNNSGTMTGSEKVNIIFSPKVELRRRMKEHIEKMSPRINSTFEMTPLSSGNSVDLFYCLLKAISKEKVKKAELYERQPFRIIHLNSLVHFVIRIFSQKQHNTIFKNMYQLFSSLFVNLMQKELIIENILSLNENFNSFTLSKVSKISMRKDLDQEISSVTKKYNTKASFSLKKVETKLSKFSKTSDSPLARFDSSSIFSKAPTAASSSTTAKAPNAERLKRIASQLKEQSFNNLSSISIIPKVSALESLKSNTCFTLIPEDRENEENNAETSEHNSNINSNTNLSIYNFDDKIDYSLQKSSTQLLTTVPRSFPSGLYSNSSSSESVTSIKNDLTDSVDSKNSDLSLSCFNSNSSSTDVASGHKTTSPFWKTEMAVPKKKISIKKSLFGKPDTLYSNNDLESVGSGAIQMNIQDNINETSTEEGYIDFQRDRDDDEDSQFDELVEIMEDFPPEHNHSNDPLKELSTIDEEISLKMSIEDFKFISFLGKGGYGSVNLYKKKDTGDFFAIKQIDISTLR